MKICIVSSYHLEVTAPFIKRLQESHTVDFIVPVNASDKNVFLFDLDATRFKQYGFLSKTDTQAAAYKQATYFSKLNSLRFFVYPNSGFSSLSLYRSFLQLARAIRKEHYDVVHVIGQFPMLALIHMLNSNAVRIHTLHETVPHSGNFKWYERFFLRFLARINAQLIFPSEITKKRFIDFTACKPEKCHTVYFGIVESYLNFFRPDIREKNKQILLFGFINAYKGVQYLADAVSLLVEKIPDIHAVIAGRWSLPELKEKLSTDPHYTIIDKTLTIEEMTSLIQESAAVVCPYTSASSSGVIMTAFAFDKPVVATAIEGITEVLEDGITGKLVQPRDSVSLAKGIENILSDNEQRQQMKDNIRKFKEHSTFSWDAITKKTVAIYTSEQNRNRR